MYMNKIIDFLKRSKEVSSLINSLNIELKEQTDHRNTVDYYSSEARRVPVDDLENYYYYQDLIYVKDILKDYYDSGELIFIETLFDNDKNERQRTIFSMVKKIIESSSSLRPPFS